MVSNRVIITVNLIITGKSYDLEIPLDISATELCTALFEMYLPEKLGDAKDYFLKIERPIGLIRGDTTLREYGIRNGTIINITR